MFIDLRELPRCIESKVKLRFGASQILSSLNRLRRPSPFGRATNNIHPDQDAVASISTALKRQSNPRTRLVTIQRTKLIGHGSMSVRAKTGLSICKKITAKRASEVHSRHFTNCIQPSQTPRLERVILTPLSWSQSRGGKTKTVVKANELPQGVLPSLPPDPSDNAPTKAYPIVLQQHLNNIRKFPDCVILTRVGDFYELYFDQVDQYAHLLNLKKARRSTVLGYVPMSGFQYTALERYLKILVHDLGLKVAISEQIRLPDDERSGKAGGPTIYSEGHTSSHCGNFSGRGIC